jgi:hypothetical protein
MAICWVEGVRPPQPMLEADAAPTPWSCGRNQGSFVLAGTGIPEEFRRNLEESGEIAGQMQEFIGIG